MSANLSETLKKLSPDQLRLLQAQLKTKAASVAKDRGWKRVNRALGHAPMSFAQESLWFLHQVDPNRLDFNLFTSLPMGDRFEEAWVRQAILLLMERHEILNMRFALVDDQPVQIFGKPHLPPLVLKSFAALDEEARYSQLTDWIEAELAQPFDLDKGPLLRFVPVELTQGDFAMFCFYHHLISDLWSMDIFTRELGECYVAVVEKRHPDLPRLPYQYADYAAWQRQELQGETLERLLTFWRKTLGTHPEPVPLNPDFARPQTPIHRAARETWVVEPALLRNLRHLARAQGATLPMVFLMLLKLVLLRQTGTEKLLVGGTIANRDMPETKGILGFFVNILMYHTQFKAAKTFVDALGLVKKTFLEANQHAALPFDVLVTNLGLAPSLHENPLTRIMFNFMPGFGKVAQEDAEEEAGSGGSFHYLTSPYELAFMIHEEDEGLYVDAEFQTSVYKPETIGRLLEHMQVLAKTMVTDPQQAFRQVPLLNEQQRQLILREWNATDVRFDTTGQLLAPIARQAELHPAATALLWETAEGTQTLSYEAFQRAVDHLALRLQQRGVSLGDCVGVSLPRSPHLVIALHAVVKTGAAYVPFDPQLPTDRLRFMTETAQCKLVIVNSITHAPFSAEQCLDFEALACNEAPVGKRTEAIFPQVPAEAPAYVIFTSGSTGQPKGAVVSHAAIDNRLHWMQKAFPIATGHRILQKTPASFDVSVWEFFWPLRQGATLVLAEDQRHGDPAYLAGFIQRQGVHVVHFVPSMLDAFLEAVEGGTVNSLTHVIASGEALPTLTATHFHKKLPLAQLANLYGPTEAAVDVTWHCCETLPNQPTVPIGKPISNVQIYLLDRHLEPVPPGAVGHLHIAGAGLGMGYYRQPARTASSFIPNPFTAGARMYRSGDLASYDADGAITFLGRADQQVKLRGFRIELGEIEAALTAHPHVQEAALSLVGHPAKTLAAYVVTVNGIPLDIQALSESLAARLPAYMVPTLWHALEHLPRTPSGKLQRSALPEILQETTSETYQAPRTPLEQWLAGAWSDVLQKPKVGRLDHFFHAGGNSIAAARVVGKIRNHLQRELPMATFFANPRVRDLALALQQNQHPGLTLPRPTPAPRQDFYPLTSAQRRLWLVDQLDPQSARYHMPDTVHFPDGLALLPLQQAIDDLIAQHAAFRTQFTRQGEHPVQQVLPHCRLPINMVDLSGLDAAARERCMAELATQHALAPLNLDQAPLLRACAVHLGEAGCDLLVNMHHIISDGLSLKLFNRDLERCYLARLSGQKPQLDALPLQYVDVAVWEQQQQATEAFRKRAEFWKNHLGTQLPVLQMPTDSPRPALQSYRGGRIPFVMDAGLVADLRALSKQEGLTLSMTMMSAFAVFLSRHAHQNDLVIGLPLANRPWPDLEPILGLFVNLLPVRLSFQERQSFHQLLSQVRSLLLACFDHQDTPFEWLLEQLNLDRDLSRNPVFQVVYNHEMGEVDEEKAQDTLELPVLAKFDLTLHIRETPTAIHGGLEYNADLFTAETAGRFVQHFQRICQTGTQNPTLPVGRLLPALPNEIPRNLAQTQAPDSAAQTLMPPIRQFEAWVAKTPDAVALTLPATPNTAASSLTYAQLNALANRMAHRFLAEGARPFSTIALHLERTPHALALLLATQKIAAAYTYLDPAYPPARCQVILEDAQPDLLICDTSAPFANDTTPCLMLSEFLADLERFPATAPPIVVDALAPSYLLYTSGTTGKPKGCMVSQAHVARLFTACPDSFNFRATDVWTLFHSLAFDFSVWEIWGALMHGARLLMVPFETSRNPKTFRQLLLEEGVTVLNQTPSAFGQLALEDSHNAEVAAWSLRLVIFGGEALDFSSLQTWFKRHKHKHRMINMYGITETCVHVTWREIQPGEATVGASYVGVPLADLQLYLLSRFGEEVPIGVPGEIFVGGAGVTHGYHQRPALTAQRFVPDPFSSKPGSRLYRSGDLARQVASGDLVYLGRGDQQVKIRGFRIELGDIQAKLLTYADISEAAVTFQEGQLCAYFATQNKESLCTQLLAQHLAQHLPEYAVPTRFAQVPHLPLTVHGKLNRAALPAAHAPGSAQNYYGEPRDPFEFRIAQIWERVLKHRPVSIHDNFFRIGGDSLSGVQAMHHINQAFGTSIPLAALFKQGTPAKLAALLRSEDPLVTLEALVPLQPQGTQQPIFWIHPIGGNIYAYIQLAWAWGTDQPFYALQAPSLSGTQAHFGSNQAAAAHYLQAIRSIQPHGPYRLAGWSSGGVLAYEIARQLHQAGENVNQLLLLDTCAPQADLPMEDWEIKVSFLLDYYRGVLDLDGRKVKKRSFEENLAWIGAQAQAKGLDINTDANQIGHLYQIFHQDMRSFEAYAIQPFPQAVTLLRAKESEEARLDPTLGWGSFLDSEQLSLHEVPGDHFSVLKPPHLSTLVATLRQLTPQGQPLVSPHNPT